MSDYSYLPQQSEEHFEAHNRNNLDFIELNPLPFSYFEDNFKERNNSINQLLYSIIFEQQLPDFDYLNYQIHIWIIIHQSVETLLEIEEKSYQTAPVFDLFSSESEHSTQTVTPEPMAQNPMQQNILITLQGIQTALGRRNNTPLPLFKGNTQDPIEWLDDFERAATTNQYDNEYKFQIVGGYLQGSPATWFSQETNVNAQQRIIRWTLANAGEDNTSFTT
ncbi:hypothetical protein G9A89_020387 [Geosiphon pyriformis]|nr:hypothetical protein G9A89_020387 [Geosiphon pyriformis]